jgi:hypothetical protein
MRIAQRLLMATPASIGSKSSLSEALALLPPLQLYRRILRVHRKLDPEMRVLGDSYVKNEFRAHRSAENPFHIVCFIFSGSGGVWRNKQSEAHRRPKDKRCLNQWLTLRLADRILDRVAALRAEAGE